MFYPENNGSRRKFIKGLAASGAALAMPKAGFPSIIGRNRLRLRVLGTHVTLQEKIRQRAERDLGIEISFEAGGSAEVLHRAATQPEAFDIYEQWSNSLKILWHAGTIQPIETSRIEHWDEINSLTRTGRLTPEASLGLGDAPYRLLHVQPDGSLGEEETGKISFLPYVHNVDSFGYNASIVPEGIPYETESWGWLLDEAWRGRVALINAPTIGLFDAAMAVEARKLMSFQNIGNMTRTEIDRLFDILLEFRREGHFRGVWTSVPHSVELMEKGQVVVESMFSPAATTLRGKGIPCLYAAPKEGYRAWHGTMCLSRAVDDSTKEAAYRYMNWWLSGWAGAFVARQGYYISNPQRSRPLMWKSEWDYWYAGKPASEPLRGTDGRICVVPGEVRRGGSYEKRFSNVAVWNTVMDHYEYTLLRWNEFLLT